MKAQNRYFLFFLILVSFITIWTAAVAQVVEKKADVPASAKAALYQVVYPLGKTTSKIVPLAPRLTDLRGKTICEVSNYVFQYKVTFPILEELLKKQYPGIKFIPYTELPNTHDESEPGKKAMASLASLLAEKGCQAIISGNGG